MSRMCYVASPIDYGKAELEDLDRARRGLQAVGMFSYFADMAFHTGEATPDHRVRKVHHRALTQADCMLAFLPGGVRSVGVPMEIEQAVAQCGIPTAVVGPGIDGSWALARPGLFVTDSVTEAVQWLDHTTCEEAWERRKSVMAVKQEHPDARLPNRAHRGDAGFDMYVTERMVIEPSTFVDVPCGISIELPEPYWGLIVGRSSTIRTRGLLVTPGIIDNGYRGELNSPVWNMTSEPVTIEVGERLAQFIPMSLTANIMDPRWTEILSPSDRGTNGFGSTGL